MGLNSRPSSMFVLKEIFRTISQALVDCARNKAPGPDGFNFSFITTACSSPGKDISNKLSEFYHRDQINKELNATFLTVILKAPNPMELKDYIHNYWPRGCGNKCSKKSCLISRKRFFLS